MVYTYWEFRRKASGWLDELSELGQPNPMALICHCAVVTSTTIRRAVADGADTPDAVAERCGAGGGCGGCVPMIEAMLEAAGHRLPVSA